MRIILFDGVCSLCNASVDFILRHDKADKMVLASQQSDVGQQLLAKHRVGSHALQTIVFIDGDMVFTESDAVLEIAKYLVGWPRVFHYFKFIPKGIRDAAYKVIAKNRYAWFGKRDTCRMPTPAERAKLLG